MTYRNRIYTVTTARTRSQHTVLKFFLYLIRWTHYEIKSVQHIFINKKVLFFEYRKKFGNVQFNSEKAIRLRKKLGQSSNKFFVEFYFIFLFV